ncbi:MULTISPECIES: hypothetical protein [Paenibacillus]|uniref:hypothetical protein n=1 Tax=Paenibacillus TaxID=44249 RepID=UPI0011A61910|nr:hypothetical protein [Paenibacillus sp. Y412MC10]
MFKKKLLVAGITTAILLTSGISVALADTDLEEIGIQGTKYVPFALQVPARGSESAQAQTDQQTKVTSGAKAGLEVNSTGGATLYVRTDSNGGGSGSTKTITSSNTYQLDSPQLAGTSVWLQFTTSILSSGVTITGNWRSN